ncbi:MAG: DUF1631 family protein [Comamonadaceae bacterium]|nr:DUF1631 family protein [Comamonadaceae bacterium]
MRRATHRATSGPGPLEVSASLYEDFLVHGVDHDTRLAESYYARIDQELAQLRAQTAAAPEGPAPSLDPQRRVDGQSPLNPEAWGAYAQSTARRLVRAELKKEATHVGQVLGLEVVRKLVNQVAQDPRLLVPVRESILALEPSLLPLAIVDPRFVSEETHPGRRLMERGAHRSCKYEDTENSEFQSFRVRPKVLQQPQCTENRQRTAFQWRAGHSGGGLEPARQRRGIPPARTAARPAFRRGASGAGRPDRLRHEFPARSGQGARAGARFPVRAVGAGNGACPAGGRRPADRSARLRPRGLGPGLERQT